MRPPTPRPGTLGDVLSDVLKRVDPDQRLRAYRIWTFWNDEVGDAIARRAQPARFRNGILFVTVATHSWMQELQFMKESIRDRLNARLGAPLVRDIFFISGDVDVLPPATESATVDEPPPVRSVVALPPITDREIADAFGRIVEARAKRLAQVQHARTKKPR